MQAFTTLNKHNKQHTRQIQPGCVFCKGKKNIELFSSKNFFVMFDESPLLNGHLIIASKEHIGCAGELSFELLMELEKVREKTTDLLLQSYGKICFFEHGRAGHCVSFSYDERLCHHFHMHALPFAKDIIDILKKRFNYIILKKYVDINSFFDRYGDYFYFESFERKKYFFPVQTDIESHLLRTVIAKKIGHPERADWKKYENYQMIKDAKKILKKSLL